MSGDFGGTGRRGAARWVVSGPQPLTAVDEFLRAYPEQMTTPRGGIRYTVPEPKEPTVTYLRSGVGEDADPFLVEALRDLGDKYGPLDVALYAARLTDPNVLVGKLGEKAKSFVVFVREDEEVELRTKPKDGSESGNLSPRAVADTAAADSEPLSTTYAREAIGVLLDIAGRRLLPDRFVKQARTAAANLEANLPRAGGADADLDRLTR